MHPDEIHAGAYASSVVIATIPHETVVPGCFVAKFHAANHLSTVVEDVEVHILAVCQSIADGGAGIEGIRIHILQFGELGNLRKL